MENKVSAPCAQHGHFTLDPRLNCATRTVWAQVASRSMQCSGWVKLGPCEGGMNFGFSSLTLALGVGLYVLLFTPLGVFVIQVGAATKELWDSVRWAR